jgi:Agenet domain
MVTTRKDDSVTKAPATCTIEGASSISPQTPISQSTVVAFPAGAEVEVKISSDGFYNSWYEAKVLARFSVTRCVKYKVQYLNLLRDDGSQQPLVEDVHAKNVRPRPPRRLSTPGNSGNEV